ncbi:hypothetical protein ACFWBB_36130 [Streptomyces sp. NPDC060000]
MMNAGGGSARIFHKATTEAADEIPTELGAHAQQFTAHDLRR